MSRSNPLKAKITKFSTTIFGQIAEATKLDETIRENLKGLDYEE